jgi:hypothetical protein
MALNALLFVSKRLQVVAAALLCLMTVQLVSQALQPSANAAVTSVRHKISLSQNVP